MKKRILLALVSVVMASMMLITSVSAASVDSFTDKDQWPDWAADSISYVIENNLMSGVGNGAFNPAGQLSRAQMAVMLYNLDKAVYGEPTIDGESKFEDIADVTWAVDAINWAADKGIVTGTNAEGTAFNPNGLITNGAMAKMLYGYVQYRGCQDLLDITRVDDTLVPVEMFYEDMMGEWKSTDWWYDSALACGAAALLVGSPNPEDEAYPLFNLNGTSMRSQAAIVLTRLHKFLSIETLEAEVIMAKWQDKYQSCVHPGQVHFLYSRNAPWTSTNSPELTQMIINDENIMEAFYEMFEVDPAEWKLEIPYLSEIRLAFRGQSDIYGSRGHNFESGSGISNIEFSLINVENPDIRIDSTFHMTVRAADGNYYPHTENYNTNMICFLPSKWTCNDIRDNYHEEVNAQLNEWQAAYLAATKQSDGKIHVAIDPDMLDVYNEMDVDDEDGSVWYKYTPFINSLQRALYYSWENTGIVNGALIATPVFAGVECSDYDFQNPENPFYVADWGDVPTEWNKYDDGTTAWYSDGDLVPKDKISVDGAGNFCYVDDSGNTHSVSTIVTERSHGPEVVKLMEALKKDGKYEVTVPLTFKLANDHNREGSVGSDAENVTFVFEANDTVSIQTDGSLYAQVVREAETPTIEALGDFYCAECGSLNMAVGRCWDWGHVWMSEDGTSTWMETLSGFLANDPNADELNKQDFFLNILRLHAGKHMDISKYTIVGATFDESLWIGGSHGNTTDFVATIKVGLAADPTAAPVEFTVPVHIEVNQHIAMPNLNDNDGVTGWTDKWPTYDGNRDGRTGDIFGCPHTDPDKDAQVYLDNFLNEYYCPIHEAIHVNVHNVDDLTKKALVTDGFKGMLMDYHNGDGWTSRYNEGNYKASATTAYKINDTTGVGSVTIFLDGWYSATPACITAPFQITIDTTNPTVGLVPAMASLTNIATGETREMCASTPEYKEFLAECEQAQIDKLDEQLAPFYNDTPVTFYYNPTHVFGHWDIGFISQTVLESVDLEDVCIHLTGNDADRFKNEVDFQGVFTRKDNGQWTWAEDMNNNRVEDGVVTGEGKVKVTVYLTTTGKAVTREVNVKYVSSWTMEGNSTTAPALTHADYEVAAEKKLRDALAEVTKDGAITVYYNTNKPEAYNFGEYVGNAIAKKAGLVCNPGDRYIMPNYINNDYHVVRLEKFGDSWNNYDPSEMPNGWLIGNGEKACENKNVTFEWLLSKPAGTNKSVFIDINVTLICDTSLPMNTAEVR